MSRERYDSAEELLYVPVTVQELDRLYAAAGKPLLDKYAIKHFLYRARHTLLAAEEGTRELTKALDVASERKRRQGTPTTLTPIDAVKFASPEELSVIVGNISSTQLKALAAAVEDAQNNRDHLAALLSATTAGLRGFAAREDLPAEVRAHVAAALAALPDIPEPIEEPRSLELGRLAGLLPPRNNNPGPDAVAPSPQPLALQAPSVPPAAAPAIPPAGTTASATVGPSTTGGPVTAPAPVAAQPWYGPPPAWVPAAAGLVLAAAEMQPPVPDRDVVTAAPGAGNNVGAHTVTVQVSPPHVGPSE